MRSLLLASEGQKHRRSIIVKPNRLARKSGYCGLFRLQRLDLSVARLLPK